VGGDFTRAGGGALSIAKRAVFFTRLVTITVLGWYFSSWPMVKISKAVKNDRFIVS
jgi:hypothetical protein